MKKWLLLFSICISLSMTKQKSTKIIFFGDSITELGVAPGGYINLIENKLKAEGEAAKYNLIGAGVSGHKVYDLFLRLEEDVLSKNPDKVLIWVGVNDVWHKQWGTGTDPVGFEKFYRALIQKMQARNMELILLTPAVVGEKHDGTNPLDKDLDAYSDIIRNLAQQYNCKLVDCRKMFIDYSKKHNPQNLESGILTTDRVHLNATGNQWVADAVWNVLF